MGSGRINLDEAIVGQMCSEKLVVWEQRGKCSSEAVVPGVNETETTAGRYVQTTSQLVVPKDHEDYWAFSATRTQLIGYGTLSVNTRLHHINNGFLIIQDTELSSRNNTPVN